MFSLLGRIFLEPRNSHMSMQPIFEITIGINIEERAMIRIPALIAVASEL